MSAVCRSAVVLLTTAATVLAQAPAELAPSESSAPPAQQAPINVQSLPPGTMLPSGTMAAPRSTMPAGSMPPGAPGMPVAEPMDYWIVSSRHCKGKNSGNTGCLQFFHRTSERDLVDRGRDAFLASIRPDQPVCFVVHGSYNWWRDVVTESRRINRWVHSSSPGAPVQVVFFTWPSDGNMPFLFPVDIAVLGRKASQHSLYLANLIGQLPPEQPVSLLGHSHGARASVAALHLLGGGAVEDGQVLAPGYATPRRLRAVLIAAAIDHNWLNPGQRYGQALLVPEQVLLMRNSRDATLAIYPLRKAGSGRAMGRDGLELRDRFALDRMGKKVVELDAAQFAGPYHSFADYHEHPELAAAITPYVFFDDRPSGGAPPYEDAASTTTARPESPVGEPETIQPAKRPPAEAVPGEDAAPLNGPKTPAKGPAGPRLVPTSLAPESDDDFAPMPIVPRAAEAPRGERPADDGTVRIYPRSRGASPAPAAKDAATMDPARKQEEIRPTRPGDSTANQPAAKGADPTRRKDGDRGQDRGRKDEPNRKRTSGLKGRNPFQLRVEE